MWKSRMWCSWSLSPLFALWRFWDQDGHAYLGDEEALEFNVTGCHVGCICWDNVCKALHLMNDCIGVGHADLVCHLWTPHLPYDLINLLVDTAWIDRISSVKKQLTLALVQLT